MREEVGTGKLVERKETSIEKDYEKKKLEEEQFFGGEIKETSDEDTVEQVLKSNSSKEVKKKEQDINSSIEKEEQKEELGIESSNNSIEEIPEKETDIKEVGNKLSHFLIGMAIAVLVFVIFSIILAIDIGNKIAAAKERTEYIEKEINLLGN